MKLNQILSKYFRIIVLNALVFLILRLFETSLIILNFGIPKSLFQSEILGFIHDILFSNTILLFVFPLFYLTHRNAEKTESYSFISLYIAFSFLHFFIVKYFIYQLVPLDTSIFEYSLKEILFTINTSEISYTKSLILLIILLATILFTNKFLNKMNFQKLPKFTVYLILFISISSFLMIQYFNITLNNFAKNKSVYFYSRSFNYFFRHQADSAKFQESSFSEFQQLYKAKQFVHKEYPLLHEFKNRNVLAPYFTQFDKAPNIVILIVEGLNDDFIHPFKGVQLMPFLSKLKDKSLYWKRCFTLGERSFAAVPSILGSLPYGKTGFTLLEKLPRHLSLVSILNANNYHTDFFYGQGAWFHQKDQFFRYNNIDLLFDNSSFSSKYEKIIVGNDQFFWGYNDKDLLNQSLEIIDAIRVKPRLDIYFTGTSHSPFAISEPQIYEAKFSQLTQKLNTDTDRIFFDTYEKYIKSVLFVDDALQSFFEKYETRPDFDNTLFLITGDHPMTEIPIKNSLKRYHVPLIIYSKNVKTAKTFNHTVSHLDVYETILSFLSAYNITAPEGSTALGSDLISDTSESTKHIAFMNDNREITDYYSDNYYLAADKLYSVNEDLSISESNNKHIKKKLQKELEIFKKTNLFVSVNDKILPDSLYYKYLGYKLIESNKPDPSLIQFNTEYYNIVNRTAIKNEPFCYDISFNLLVTPEKNLSLVYQLSTKNDSVIFWGSSDLTDGMKDFTVQIKIPKQTSSDSIIFFGSYLWKKNSQNFKFDELRYSIHQK